MASEAWRDKIDGHLRARLASADAATTDEPVMILVALDGDATTLGVDGFVLGSQAGGIAIGQAPISALPSLARLPQVRFIEMSRSLPFDQPSE